MTFLILGAGTAEIIILIILLFLIPNYISYKLGKSNGEKKAYKEVISKSNNSKSIELIRLEKLLADRLITEEEFSILKEKIK